MDQHLTTLTTLSLQTAYNSIPLKKYSPYKKKQVWNENLHQAQQPAQQAYKVWKAAGKPRNSDYPVHNRYKSISKGKFHSLLRHHNREGRENFFASLDLHKTDPQKIFCTIWQKQFLGVSVVKKFLSIVLS